MSVSPNCAQLRVVEQELKIKQPNRSSRQIKLLTKGYQLEDPAKLRKIV